MSKQDWPISIRNIGANTKEAIRQIRKSNAYLFYPIFLLYGFTLIGFAKLIQIIF